MFNAEVGLFGCSAARFRLFIRLIYKVQRAILAHDHPNCGRFAVSSLAVFYGEFILAFHACALAFTRVGEGALVIACLFCEGRDGCFQLFFSFFHSRRRLFLRRTLFIGRFEVVYLLIDLVYQTLNRRTVVFGRCEQIAGGKATLI